MYIARSSHIVNTVSKGITKMRDAELANYDPPVSQTDATQLVNLLLWQKNLHLLPQLPTAWLTKMAPSDVDITVVDSTKPDRHRRPDLTTVKFPASRGVVYPPVCHDTPHWQRYAEAIIADSKVHDAAYAGLPGIEEVQAATTLAREREIVVQKWEKVEADVVKLLRSCSSLNEAVRLVPSIKLYLPQELRDRLDQKSEPVKRRSRAEREAALMSGLDADSLAAAAVHGTFLVNSK